MSTFAAACGTAAALLLVVPLAAQAPPSAQVKTTNPHGELTEPCASCHSADGWKPAHVSASFKHAPSRFPLLGAHARTSCRACHTSLDFKQVSDRCNACHVDVHGGELGADCGRCHTPRNFLDRSVMVRAHQTTRFPLTGAHLMADCQACHAPVAQGHLSFVNRPTQCAGCHFAKYALTTNPAHQAAGFSQVCEQCHLTISWDRAAYDHASSGFALTGAHKNLSCSTNGCHADGVYAKRAGVSCVSCHLANFSNTTNPPHQTAGFPQSCADCHSTATWAGARFAHTWFPISSGRHSGIACTTCHATSGTYTLFSCRTCHGDTHGKNYTDQQCYSCHPTGQGGG